MPLYVHQDRYYSITKTKSNSYDQFDGDQQNPQIEIPTECKPAKGSASAGEDADAWWCKAIVDMQDGEDINVMIFGFDIDSILRTYHSVEFALPIFMMANLVNYPSIQFCKAIGNMHQCEKTNGEMELCFSLVPFPVVCTVCILNNIWPLADVNCAKTASLRKGKRQ